jgi:hypothetical protein
MHIGGERPLRVRGVAEEPEKLFNPEAALTDGNPFPEQQEVVETTPVGEEGPTDYDSLTVEELKALLRARGLDIKGKKAELVARLIEADTPSEEAVEVDEVVPSQEAAASDDGVSENNAENSRPNEPLGE